MSSNEAQTRPLGRVVGGGMAWMFLATVVAKLSSFLAQIILGILLLKEDFGIYALAISITVILQVIREGGTRRILLQKGAHRFDKLVCPVFWLALVFNMLSAGAMIAAAPLAAMFYDEPGLTPMLIVISLGIMASTHGTIYRTKLASQLRYRELAKMRSSVVFLRNASMVLFALLGYGAMSFAWPFLVASLVEWGIGLWMCGRLHLFRSPRLRLWPKLFGVSSWMLVSTLALAIINQSPYAIVGYFVPKIVLGVYFFGSQLVLQINIIFAGNLQDVLLPALSSMNHERERQNAAVVRTVRALVFASSCAAFGVAVVIPELESLVWGEKWADAVPVIQWMCVFIPFRVLQGVIEPVALARSGYKLNALLLGTQAVIISAAALIAGRYFEEPWQFAAIVGFGYAISVIIAGSIGCNRLGISMQRCVLGFVPAWIVGIGCFLLAQFLKEQLMAQLFTEAIASERISSIIGFLIGGSIFTLLFMLATRTLLKRVLVEFIGMLPGRFRGLARRVTLLPQIS